MNQITLYGQLVDYPKQASVDKRGKAYYKLHIASERESGIVDTLPVLLEEGTDAYNYLVELDSKKDITGLMFLIEGRVHTRSYRTKNGSNQLNITVRAETIEERSEYSENTNAVGMIANVCKMKGMRITPRGIRITDIMLMCGPDYIPAIAWNGTAIRVAERLQKGDKIFLQGRLQSRRYRKELKNGETEYRTCYELSIERYENVN